MRNRASKKNSHKWKELGRQIERARESGDRVGGVTERELIPQGNNCAR